MKNKKSLAVAIVFLLFVSFLIVSTKILLKKQKTKEEINVVDIPLKTVYLIPNNGVVEISVQNVNTTSNNVNKYVTADTRSINTTQDPNYSIEKIAKKDMETIKNTNSEIQIKAPKTEETTYKIPETGLSLKESSNFKLYSVVLLLFGLGALLRLFIKTIV